MAEMKTTGVPLEPDETGWGVALFIGAAFAAGLFALISREHNPFVLLPASFLVWQRFGCRPAIDPNPES